MQPLTLSVNRYLKGVIFDNDCGHAVCDTEYRQIPEVCDTEYGQISEVCDTDCGQLLEGEVCVLNTKYEQMYDKG